MVKIVFLPLILTSFSTSSGVLPDDNNLSSLRTEIPKYFESSE